MTLQEWKAKINSYFQPKTPDERQKMMKYLVVFPAAILSGVLVLWILYTNLNGGEKKTGDAFNTEIPAGESEKIGTKVQEYEAADAAKEKEKRQVVLNSVSNITKAITPLADYTVIQCYLDNDTAGRAALARLRREFGDRVMDKSALYPDHKDLNDYLMSLNPKRYNKIKL